MIHVFQMNKFHCFNEIFRCHIRGQLSFSLLIFEFCCSFAELLILACSGCMSILKVGLQPRKKSKKTTFSTNISKMICHKPKVIAIPPPDGWFSFNLIYKSNLINANQTCVVGQELYEITGGLCWDSCLPNHTHCHR